MTKLNLEEVAPSKSSIDSKIYWKIANFFEDGGYIFRPFSFALQA